MKFTLLQSNVITPVSCLNPFLSSDWKHSWDVGILLSVSTGDV